VPERRLRQSILFVTAAALIFQLGHLSEHTAQMAMWFIHPQRAAWMSPWASDLAVWLGRADPGRASEMTLELQRGVELLHLVGNGIFLIGTLGLLWLTRRIPTTGAWARRATLLQLFHTAEHVSLVASIFISDKAIGLSTGFGLLDGTRLSTVRVLWHGSVNLLVTGVCAVAVVRWLRPSVSVARRTIPANRLLASALAVASLAPFLVGFVVGKPILSSARAAAASMVAGPAEISRSGNPQPRDLRLVDVAAESGLDVVHSAFRWDVSMDPVAMMGGGACWIDVDRDGWLDLFLTDTWANGEWGLWNAGGNLPTTRIFHNVGGRFEELTEQWGAGFETRANGCVAADFDNDGFTDLYVTTSRANLLLWNNAGTGFVDGAEAAGVDLYGWHTGAAAGDLNGDGMIDLVVAGYADLNHRRTDASTGFPNTFEPIADSVMINQGTSGGGRPTFEPVAGIVGIEPDGSEYGLGVVLTDFDHDSDLDLYVANDTQPNRLYINEPSSTSGVGFVFTEVGATSGIDDSRSGMGVATSDINNDGLTDLVVTNLSGQGHGVYLSDRGTAAGPTFHPGMPTVEDLGLLYTGWGDSFGDLDLDGDLDLLIASGQVPITDLEGDSQPVTYLSNLADTGAPGFADWSSIVGLDRLAPRNGRSVTLADFDNDGDLDALITAIGQPLALLQNRNAEGHWLEVDGGTPTPGMRITVKLADGTSVDRVTTAGGGWMSSGDPRVHIGLGSHDSIAKVEVVLPDGTSRVFDNVEVDQILRP